MTATPAPRLLFVDSDPEFLAALKSDRKAAIVPPLLVDSGAKAMEILGNLSIELNAIFVGQEVQSPDCLSVIRRARQTRPTTPVLLVYPGIHCTLERSILDKVGGCEAIPKDFTYGEMARKYFPPELLFEPSDALAKSAHRDTPLGHEQDHDPEEFIAIRADSFLSGKKAYFDLYVKIGANRLIKILKANDDFTRDRLDGYISKGVEHFYIHKDSQQEYLAYSHKLTSGIVAHASVQAEVKVNYTLNGGEAVLAFLRQNDKVDPEQLRFAESYVRQVDELIEALGIDKQSALLAAILRNPEMREHTVGATILAGLIGHQLGFETKKSAALLGIGCLLHDAGIPAGQESVETVEEEEMSDVQRRAWLEHPAKGAKLLTELRGLNPVIIDIVSNHHRRRDGTGFPNTGGISKITVPTEVVASTDEIVRLFMMNPNAPTEELNRKINLFILPAFSPDVVDAIRIVLKTGAP